MRRIVPPLLLALSLAVPAAAQPAEPPGAERVKAALARRDAGDLAGAIAALEPARREPDAPAVVLEALGGLYLEADRPADALAVLLPRVAAGGDKPDPVVLFNVARAEIALGRPADAEAHLKTAIARVPVSRAALLLWELLSGQKRHREAADVLAPLATEPTASEVEKIDAELAADIALQYARSLVAAGDQVAAIAALQRRTRLRPAEEEGWRLLGDALLEAGRLDEARDALAHAQEISERQRDQKIEERAHAPEAGLGFDALMQRAAERRAAGDLEGALEALTGAVRIAPRDPRPRMLQVQILLSMGRGAEALPRAEELVDLAGGHPWTIYLRGMARLAAGDPAGAEPDFRLVLDKIPDHVPAMNGLAEVLMARGDLDEAERLTRRALVAAPDNPVAAQNLEEIATRRRAAGGSPSSP